MQYKKQGLSIDEGFQLFEKITEPILLIHKFNKVLRANEAGRKLLSLTKISQEFVHDALKRAEESDGQISKRWTIPTRSRSVHVVVRQTINSEYYLVEIFR